MKQTNTSQILDDFTIIAQKFMLNILDASDMIEKQYGVDVRREFTKILMTHFVGSYAFKSLSTPLDNQKKKGSKLTLYKDTVNEYESFKSILTESVATGLKEAVEQFSGSPIDYYCAVYATGAPTNQNPI